MPTSRPRRCAQLALDSSGFVRAAVALNSQATAEILEALAGDEMTDYDSTLQMNRYLVKEAVAKSPNINQQTLTFLARDSDENIRASAASNTLLTIDQMKKMVKDVNWLVRNNIAINPSTPEELLIYLSADRIMDVRATAAQNPRTPAEALATLAKDKSWEIREAVARNPKLDGKILDELADHWSWLVREAVAKNSNTPTETIERLAQDPDQSVQKAARERNRASA